jgi:hypothetical protein
MNGESGGFPPDPEAPQLGLTGPEPTWTITRSQLIDALASIKLRGVQLPGQTIATVLADDMADAILEQLPGGDGSVTVSREDLVTVLAAMDPWVEAEPLESAFKRLSAAAGVE